jgi:Flp pilus assembly protein TadG
MQRKRKQSGGGLVEAMVAFFVFIPLALFAADLFVLFHTAQMNEEFAEQLARLCSTLPDKTNAAKACEDVIKQYQRPSNITSITLDKLEFDVGLLEVGVTTSMDVALPVPFPGFTERRLTASVKQPLVSRPAPP